MADAKKKTPPPPKRKQEAAGSRRGLWITLIAAGAVAIVVAGALIFLSQRSGEGGTGGADAAEVEAGKLVGVKEVQDRFADIPQEGAVLGDPNAPVTITEFADLRCPACKLFATDYFPTVVDELVRTGKAKYEFRIWPILGTDSVLAAQAGIAAQQQNKLFEYQDLWYLNQQDESRDYATDAYVDGVAKALGLDLAAFQAARQDDALWTPLIQDVQVIAAQNNFGGTPSFLISGPGGEKILSGGVPEASTIAEAVEEVS
jgi:protein-disulfide isomerase